MDDKNGHSRHTGADAALLLDIKQRMKALEDQLAALARDVAVLSERVHQDRDAIHHNRRDIQDIKTLLNQGRGGIKALVRVAGFLGTVAGLIAFYWGILRDFVTRGSG